VFYLSVTVETPYADVTHVKYKIRGNDMQEKYFDLKRMEPEQWNELPETAKGFLIRHEEFMNIAYEDGYGDGKAGKEQTVFEKHRKINTGVIMTTK